MHEYEAEGEYYEDLPFEQPDSEHTQRRHVPEVNMDQAGVGEGLVSCV